jgi:hypothetical protein
MPKGYEEIRDKLIEQGKSEKEAKTLAAKIWNSKHPENPVGRNYDYSPKSKDTAKNPKKK